MPSKFAVFKYDYIQHKGYYPKCVNLGDYIQSLAAMQYLPADVSYIDRDKIASYQGNPVKLIANAWYHSFEGNAVFNKQITPLLTSIHINNVDEVSAKTLAYFKAHEPIGCRDLTTLKFLQNKGIKAYFSACLTLTLDLKYPEADLEPLQLKTAEPQFYGKKIILCDYDLSQKNEINSYLKEKLKKYPLKQAFFTSHALAHMSTQEQRFKIASQLINEYAKAKLVITSKLHCALVCLAFKTPVIFIPSCYDENRFPGLIELLNHIYYDKKKKKLIIHVKFDKDGKVVNSTKYLKYAEALKQQASDFVREEKKETKKDTISPAFQENNIPIVFSVNNDWAPYLGVTIASLVDHINQKDNYDLIVFHRNVSNENQKKIKKIVKNYRNVSVRFFDMNPILNSYRESDFFLTGRLTLETYFRFFIPTILEQYEKIVYLDSDLAVLKDIALLFKIPVDLIAACPGLTGQCAASYMPDKAKYFKKIKIKNLHKYFNAGILVMNLKTMRAEKFTDQLMQALQKIKHPQQHDQDILNMVCNQRVQMVDVAWNFPWLSEYQWFYRVLLPNDLLSQWYKASLDPFIVHYVHRKPWQYPEWQYALHFWKYARRTPFLQDIIEKNLIYLEPHFLPFKEHILYIGWAKIKRFVVSLKNKSKQMVWALHQDALCQANKIEKNR